jgi:hypothetical protein
LIIEHFFKFFVPKGLPGLRVEPGIVLISYFRFFLITRPPIHSGTSFVLKLEQGDQSVAQFLLIGRVNFADFF